MPLTIVWGAIFMLLADTAARTVLAPSELPVGVVTPCFTTSPSASPPANGSPWWALMVVVNPRCSTLRLV